MAAAAMLQIQMNASTWAITTRFDENWYTNYEKHAEFKKSSKRKCVAIFKMTAPYKVEAVMHACILCF
jgi:hypothetical protein